MIKQVILDMQNQLLQVKTQVAIAIADQHVLERKQTENEEQARGVDAQSGAGRGQGTGRPGARRARTRHELQTDAGELRASRWPTSASQVEELKTALRKLEQKLAEAKSLSDVLIARHRRSRALAKASDARMAMADGSSAAAFDRMQRKVHRTARRSARPRPICFPTTPTKSLPNSTRTTASSRCWLS